MPHSMLSLISLAKATIGMNPVSLPSTREIQPDLQTSLCWAFVRQDVEAITYFNQFREDFAGDCHRSLKRVFHVQAGDSPA
jgi:hypothetical protein